MEHAIESGTASQEINFWAQMDRSLRFIKEQIVRDEVKMTLDILMQSTMHRRVVFAFRNDTEIVPKHQKAQNYNGLLKDIPINELLDATTLKQMRDVIKKIFDVLMRVRTMNHYSDQSNYTPQRTVDLAECVARDFDNKLKKVISERPIMQIPFSQLQEFNNEISELEKQWKESVQELKKAIGQSGRGGMGGNAMMKGGQNMRSMEDKIKQIMDGPVFRRLSNIISFRSEHHKLEEVISTTFAKSEAAEGRSGFRN